ncbi:MAG: hypothetical protein RIM99_17685 [Cyclobacteriaceae bacterium]
MTEKKINKSVQVLFLACLMLMLWLYSQGYKNSIGWEVTTSAEVISYPAIEIEGELLDFQVTGEKYLLTESFTGGPILRNRLVDTLFISAIWLGLCIALTGASFLKRYAFLFALALYTLFINRLNPGEVELFGIQGKLSLFIPFLAVAGPLFYFHEYRPKTSFLMRLLVIVAITTAIAYFGVSQWPVFIDHFVGHSLFAFAIAGLLFLFILAEENLFGILFLVTRGKGGTSNHVHFMIIGGLYLLNLILHYLNKSGIVTNSFSFFDPFIFLFISSVVSFLTITYKRVYLSPYISGQAFSMIFYGLGIILFSMLGQAFFRGNDAVYESFHYFILYFHIGFGFFFFLYIIINFIDPLVQGFEVFRIAYKEQNFPYVSARLGGLMVVLGFYFLATQEPYELLRSGYYSSLGNLEETQGNPDLADQYYRQAAFLGYNTHHSNYQLAWKYSDKGNKYLTAVHFEKAASRFPSPFAYVNYANLDMEINQTKVQATLERAVEQFNSGEIKNNLGILRMRNEEWSKALEYFDNASSENTWNQAPLLNKWAALYKAGAVDSAHLLNEYMAGNTGVKANILTSFNSNEGFNVDYLSLRDAPPLHRQSFFLNALPTFSDDSLATLSEMELEQSTNANYNDRLRKAMAIHHYLKGDINKAFLMLNYLQSNSYQHKKGGYLSDMGKLALDQGAYELAEEFFQRAAANGNVSAEINRLEAMTYLGRSEEIKDELLRIVKNDPGLTALANQILDREDSARFERKQHSDSSINTESLSDDELIEIGGKNAFEETIVIAVVQELTKRNNPVGYNLILEATELNPYSADLLKTYVVTALSLNLTGYAGAVLPRIKELVNDQEYAEFLRTYNALKKDAESSDWQ